MLPKHISKRVSGGVRQLLSKAWQKGQRASCPALSIRMDGRMTMTGGVKSIVATVKDTRCRGIPKRWNKN